MVRKGAVHPGDNRRVQLRAQDPRAFDEVRRQTFLDHLAGCCNVTRAAETVGVSTVTVNNHRRKDPAFAAQCDEALETGYHLLEAALIERAAGASYDPGPDASTAPGPDSIDTALALQLLSLRGKSATARSRIGGPRLSRSTEKELNTAILAKLEVLDRRLTAGRPLGFKGRKGTRA